MDKVSYENEIEVKTHMDENSYENYEMTCEISFEFIWELWDDFWDFIWVHMRIMRWQMRVHIPTIWEI